MLWSAPGWSTARPIPTIAAASRCCLTEAGEQRLSSPPATDASLEARFGRLAHSELRALERGFEILERLPR